MPSRGYNLPDYWDVVTYSSGEHTVSAKGQMTNILGLVGHTVFVATI